MVAFGYGTIPKPFNITVGLPVSAVASFCVVYVLSSFEETDNNEKLVIEIFDQTFSGPSGPVTLWVFCYLAITTSIALLQLTMKKD